MRKPSIRVMQKKVKDAPTAGGAKTKAKKALKEVALEERQVFYQLERADSAVLDKRVGVAQMLDEATIKDWDLLPTGYNRILSETDQFPWWGLMKNKFRKDF